MPSLLTQFIRDFPALHFAKHSSFFWSPQKQTVYYSTTPDDDTPLEWKLLHETAHGLLQHTTYQTDFELLQLESDAWEKAVTLAKRYAIQIDPEHIEDCLDSYRDWLYARSTCPTCRASGLMTAKQTYTCPNCRGVWHVSSSRFCRPYRRSITT